MNAKAHLANMYHVIPSIQLFDDGLPKIRDSVLDPKSYCEIKLKCQSPTVIGKYSNR